MALGDNCRAGCRTRDHRSWGECARAAAPAFMDGGRHKAWDGELQAYRDARAQGAQPAGTSLHQVRQALDASDRLGRAFNAETDPLPV